MSNIRNSRGAIDGWMIATIGLILLVIGVGSLAIWAFLSYQEQKTNVDGKIDLAVAEAETKQAEELHNKFLEEEKKPGIEFVGPEDYGSLSFTYPKTWSVYIDRDLTTTGNDFKAYLHPETVPPISVRNQRYALRVSILSQGYDAYVKTFERLVSDGSLRSSTVTINGESGTRLDGNFSDAVRGSAVIFKLRDKTVVLQSDADTFKQDFDALLQTVAFVK